MDSKRVRFDYFYEEESEQFAFYRIPKALFTDEMFVALSTDAKLLYGLMLDRMSLSRRNQWIDEDGHVYIVFTVEEISEYLNCGKDKAIKIMAELDEEKGIGLIQKIRHGMGKPAQIYVKNFTSGYVYTKRHTEELVLSRKSRSSEVGKTDFNKSGKSTSRSRKNRPQEVGKSDLNKSGKPTSINLENRPLEVGKTDSNNINSIYTELTNTDLIHPSSEGGWMELERTIKENIGYEYLVDGYQIPTDLLDDIVGIMVEILAFPRESVNVGDVEYPYEFVRGKLLKLNQFHIQYVISSLKEAAPKMANPKAYLLKCLMNAPMTINAYYQTRVQHDMRQGLTL